MAKRGPAARVLIVEDDPVSALLLRRVLEQRGYQVDHRENGVEGLREFLTHRHGIVISDWMMPEMDGVSLTREIRQLGGQYTYTILLSAKGQRDDRLEAFEAGVDDFLTKPLDRDELYARLKVAERILSAEESLRRQKEELAIATDRLKVANQNLLLASRRFEELFAGMPVACFTFDGEGIIHEWNRSSEELFGRKAHDAIFAPIWHSMAQRDHGFWRPDLITRVFEGKPVQNLDWSYVNLRGEQRDLVCNVFALRGATGDVIGGIAANLDITDRRAAERKIEQQKRELEEVNARLSQLAVTDGLTGLWNHRRFREELDKNFASHSRKEWPLSLILLDVDHFKAFNDNFGHPAGDEVLKQVAALLKATSRSYEAVARYGGEEFAIILPNANSEDAQAAAERFRVAIEKANWPHRAITASFGVATLESGEGKAEELVQRADVALYASKQAGRNRVSHFDQVEDHMADSAHLGVKKRTA